MDFEKKSHLSARSKRRRIQEELERDNYIVMGDSNYDPTTINSNFSFQTNNQSGFQPLNATIDKSSTNQNPQELVRNQDVFEFLNEKSSVIFTSSSSESEQDEDYLINETYDQTFLFRTLIAKWAVDFNIPQNALNKLLVVLKQHKCFKDLPKDSRTILQSKTVDPYNFDTVEPGTYYHFGILNGIKSNFPECLKDNNDIHIVVGVDGLPIFKSNPEQFWPILAYIRPENNNVFLVGLYCGKEKPADSNSFIKSFTDEAHLLNNTGICINNKVYNLYIDTFCCDAPAKSFLLKTKGHSGFFSCSRCEHEGLYLSNRLCFPFTSPTRCPSKRTHENYVMQSNEDHHVGNVSLISTLPSFDVVNNFSLDYMHLVCLGVVRKLILLWIKGPVSIRYPSWKIREISKHLENIKVNIPCEFARKPRKLEEVNRWKATEFRMFLLYVGTTVTKNVLTVEHWKHFFGLSVAMILLLSPDHAKFINIARKLLDNFVKNFENIYGSHLISHNVHGLTHICDDYEKFGPLDNCSAFPFENFMGSLKKMLRKPDKPLQQIVKRYNEICNLKTKIQTQVIAPYQLGGPHVRGPILENVLKGDQFTCIVLETMTIKTNIEADSYLLTSDDDIVKVFNIICNKNLDEVILICKKFKNKHIMFNNPIKSSKLGIYMVDELCNNFKWYKIGSIKKKVILLPNNNKFIALPTIHSTKK